jgi:tetratricopeptide (TPR) repeat protein
VAAEHLAQERGLKEATVAYLEQGKQEPQMTTLERLMIRMGGSSGLLEELLDLAKEVRAGRTTDVWVGPVLVPGAQMRGIREFGYRIGRFWREDYCGRQLRQCAEEQVERDRERARQIGLILRGEENVVEYVRATPECHLWSVSEWLCDESRRAVRKNPPRAAQYAEAALVAAELAPGDERFRQRESGFCWAHIGNVQRVRNAWTTAEESFSRYSELWVAGRDGDPYGTLDEGRVLNLEASLRRDQGRLTEAVVLLRRALSVATGHELPYVRLNYAYVLEQTGEYESAIGVLEGGAADTPKQLLWQLRINMGVSLCRIGRYREAEDLLPEIDRLALEAESQDYQLRSRWLRGRVDAGRGRVGEALGRLRSVQAEFRMLRYAYDAALVSLDLARLYLEQGETAKVKRLAEEMATVFVDVGVHARAQEALEMFREAAEKEKVTVDLVERVERYLHRARFAPGLRFDAAA